MRPVASCLILLLAPSLAWAAAPTGIADPDRGSCVDSPRSGEHSMALDGDPNPASHSGTARSHTSTTQGGGDGDLFAPRMRMPRWHSYLPGMFR